VEVGDHVSQDRQFDLMIRMAVADHDGGEVSRVDV